MRKNKDIGIGISTFLRDDSLLKLIESLSLYCPEFKLYIVDQGEYSNWKKIIYKGLQKLGNSINFIPFDSGISMARKTLKSMCQEPYLVFMQDDFIVTEKTNLYKLQEVLEEDKKLGVCGGKIENAPSLGYYFDYADDKLCYFPTEYLLNKNIIKWQNTKNNIPYIYTEIIPDFTMWKKETPNIFDINVKTIEHTHSYLLLKYNSSFRVAYCPSCEIQHIHNMKNVKYNEFRKRKKDIDYMKEYWKVSEFFKFDKRILCRLENNISNIIPIEKTTLPTIQPIETKKEIPMPQYNTCNPETNNQSKIINLIDYLNKNNIKFWLLKESCLETILKKEIISEKLHIGVHSIINKNFIYDSGLNEEFLTVYVEAKRQTKPTKLYNLDVNVPCPVVKYLENTFKKSWEELKHGI